MHNISVFSFLIILYLSQKAEASPYFLSSLVLISITQSHVLMADFTWSFCL